VNRQRITCLLLLSLCLGCDQLTKQAAVHFLRDRGPVDLLNGCFRLIYSQNTGGWGGLGGQLASPLRALLLTGLPLAIMGVVAARLFSPAAQDWKANLSLTLVLAGGLGNILDRIFRGYVVDFMYLGYGSVGTNIFNLADMIILVGIGGLLLTPPESPAAPGPQDVDLN